MLHNFHPAAKKFDWVVHDKGHQTDRRNPSYTAIQQGS